MEETTCQLLAAYDADYSALLDGELSSEREAELRAHLVSCACCHARLAALERVDTELAALGSPAPAADLRARLQQRIDADAGAARPLRKAPPRRRRWRGASLAAAVAAAAAVALYLVVAPEPSPPTPEPQVAKTPSVPPRPQVPETPSVRPEPRVVETPSVRPEPRVVETPARVQRTGTPPTLEDEPVEDVGLALELDTIEDLDVIANLDLLEALVALEEGTG